MRRFTLISILAVSVSLAGCGGSGESVRDERVPVVLAEIAPAYVKRTLALPVSRAERESLPLVESVRDLDISHLTILPEPGQSLPEIQGIAALLEGVGSGISVGIGCRLSDPQNETLLERLRGLFEKVPRLGFVEFQWVENTELETAREVTLLLLSNTREPGFEVSWYLPSGTDASFRRRMFAWINETPGLSVVVEAYGPGANVAVPPLGYLSAGERAQLINRAGVGIGMTSQTTPSVPPWEVMRQALVAGRALGFDTARLELNLGGDSRGLPALELGVFATCCRQPFRDTHGIVVELLRQDGVSPKEARRLADLLKRYTSLHQRVTHYGPIPILEDGTAPTLERILALGMALEDWERLREGAASNLNQRLAGSWARQVEARPPAFDAAVWDMEHASMAMEEMAVALIGQDGAEPCIQQLQAALERDRQRAPAMIRCLSLARAAYRFFELNRNDLNREQLYIEVERLKNVADATAMQGGEHVSELGAGLNQLVGQVLMEMNHEVRGGQDSTVSSELE